MARHRSCHQRASRTGLLSEMSRHQALVADPLRQTFELGPDALLVFSSCAWGGVETTRYLFRLEQRRRSGLHVQVPQPLAVDEVPLPRRRRLLTFE